MEDLPEVPERIRISVDDSWKLEEKVTNFFIETKEYLEEMYGKSPSFEIYSNQIQNSNDILTYLVYKDKCVASVLKRRTSGNHLEAIFSRELRI